MRGLIVFSLAALLILGLLAYQSPRVRELFDSAPGPAPKERPAPAKSAPEAEVAGDRDEVARPADSQPAPAARPAPSVPARAREGRPKSRETSPPKPEAPSPPPPKPTVSNAEVSSVVMGIFRARQIYGVSLMVSDSEIEVAGEVVSEQQRRQVLETIEKAREYRRVVAKDLKVRQP